ncbi:pentapeptide repeat-containing protein [Streptomyces collinus]|uniref:pentapeptide repeat-containing protein n=1 Tax=Streptomyces collinus TaxID=42684 RepID=UPI0033241686
MVWGLGPNVVIACGGSLAPGVSDLRGADLRRADLTNADFTDAKLEGVKLGGAKRAGATGLPDEG